MAPGEARAGRGIEAQAVVVVVPGPAGGPLDDAEAERRQHRACQRLEGQLAPDGGRRVRNRCVDYVVKQASPHERVERMIINRPLLSPEVQEVSICGRYSGLSLMVGENVTR